MLSKSNTANNPTWQAPVALDLRSPKRLRFIFRWEVPRRARATPRVHPPPTLFFFPPEEIITRPTHENVISCESCIVYTPRDRTQWRASHPLSRWLQQRHPLAEASSKIFFGTGRRPSYSDAITTTTTTTTTIIIIIIAVVFIIAVTG